MDENEFESYIYKKGKYLKYVPLYKSGSVAFSVKKEQNHFEYFDYLFSVENPNVFIDIDYLLPGHNGLEELYTSKRSTYIGGSLNLQFKDSVNYGDYVIYEFYMYVLERVSTDKELVLKNLIRAINIDKILD